MCVYVIDEDIIEISKYIFRYFENNSDKNEKISPIKLQKSLYFLFSFWVKIKNDIEKSKKFLHKDEFSSLSDKLFKVNFEAWSYGPVVKEVYFWNKRNYKFEDSKYNNLNNLTKNKFVTDFFESLLKSIINTKDFDLVKISHNDFAWKNAYNSNKKFIDIDEIIDEYKQK